jgi:hypothetical protein
MDTKRNIAAFFIFDAYIVDGYRYFYTLHAYWRFSARIFFY